MPKSDPFAASVPPTLEVALAARKHAVVEDHDCNHVELWHNLTDADVRVMHALCRRNGCIAFPEVDEVRFTWSHGEVRGVKRINGYWYGIWRRGAKMFAVDPEVGMYEVDSIESATRIVRPFMCFRDAAETVVEG